MKSLIWPAWPLLGVLLTTGLPSVSAEPVLIPADADAGFNFPYVLIVPTDPAQDQALTLVVETNNTGEEDDFDTTLAATRKQAAGRGLGPMLSRHLKLPFLMPVFPRPKSDWKTYTHALDRDSMLIEEGSLTRLDQQLLAMIEDARKRLAEDGMPTRDQVVMVGFSASGSFANRFAFLHPERLCAVVAGGVNAFPMLPVPARGGHRLAFPLGIDDIEELSGAAFNETAWKALPQMIFMGALDENDAVLFDDAYSDKERETIFSVVGKPMHTRWLNCQKVYLEAGASANLITYGQVGHWINRHIGLSIVSFVEEVLSGQT